MNWLTSLKLRYAGLEPPLKTERRVELALLVFLLIVLLQLIGFTVGKLTSPSIDPLPPAADSVRVTALVTEEAVSSVDSLRMQTRPLFWPDRRPEAEVTAAPDPDEATSGAPARSLQKFELTGVFGGGDSGGAIVTYKGNRQRLLVGDEIDGWTLLSVSPGEVVFTSAGVRDVRRLTQVPVRADAVATAPRATASEPAQAASSPASRASGSRAKTTTTKPNATKPTTKSTMPPSGGSLSLGGSGVL